MRIESLGKEVQQTLSPMRGRGHISNGAAGDGEEEAERKQFKAVKGLGEEFIP